MAKIKGHDWEKLYNNYVKKWAYWNEKLPKGMDDKLLGRASFRDVYTNLEDSRKIEQEMGLRGKSLNVMRDIINAQKYKLTKKAASNKLKAMREYYYGKISGELSKSEFKKEMQKINKEITFKGLREDTVDKEIYSDKFWDEVRAFKETYDNLKDKDGNNVFTKEEVRHAIGVTFFGSWHE